MATSPRKSIPLPESTTAKVAAATALVAAAAGLVKGGVDIYNAVVATPVGESERTNEAKFKEHFGKVPLVEQPVVLRDNNDVTEMLVQVYHNGDLLVRYSGVNQWLPYKKPNGSPPRTFALFSAAYAQAPPPLPSIAPKPTNPSAPAAVLNWKRPPIAVDLEAYRRAAIPSAAAPQTSVNFALSDIQYSGGGFSSTTRAYEKVFPASPGHRITGFDLQPASLNNARIRSAEIVDGGKAVRVQYTLTSGPVFDQYRGWIHATMSVNQTQE